MAPKISEDEIDDLLYAARIGDKDELATLISSLAEREGTLPADVLANAKDEGKSTCLHMAAGNGHVGEHFPPDRNPHSPLGQKTHTAVNPLPNRHSTDIVNLLLSHFSDPVPKEDKKAFLDAPNEFGNTGLHWAAGGGHLAVVKLLVENGASPALANEKNYVPLDLASLGDKVEVVDYFLAQSRELETENVGEGMSAGAGDVKLDDEADEGQQGE